MNLLRVMCLWSLAGVSLGGSSACSLAVSNLLDEKPSAQPTDAGAFDSSARAEAGPDADLSCSGCPAEQCCQGQCVDLQSSAQHCGRCGQACSQGAVCRQAHCQELEPMSVENQPSPRAHACGVWTDAALFVWGGGPLQGASVADGALYQPGTNSWTPIASSPALSARRMASCVWTQSAVWLWGGVQSANSGPLCDGALWFPSDGHWEALQTQGAPPGRLHPALVWTGQYVIVWGGEDERGHQERTGARYQLSSRRWLPISAQHAPSKARGLAYAWLAPELWVFGGRDDSDNVSDETHKYNPDTDTWTEVRLDVPPPARSHAFAAAVGGSLVLWGGWDKELNPRADGAVLTPPESVWRSLAGTAPIGARAAVSFDSGWSSVAGSAILLWGGLASPSAMVQSDGSEYDLANGRWLSGANWSFGTEHRFGVSVWTGQKVLIWGGYDGSQPSTQGLSWKPQND